MEKPHQPLCALKLNQNQVWNLEQNSCLFHDWFGFSPSFGPPVFATLGKNMKFFTKISFVGINFAD
jgi:hypothetical protein